MSVLVSLLVSKSALTALTKVQLRLHPKVNSYEGVSHVLTPFFIPILVIFQIAYALAAFVQLELFRV
ncbi:hypothetical protein DJ61_4240 [Yersinia enterocolitica]|nr:hypothetical protein DJ61_4240 [Yersinia enterocolitica]